MKKKIDRSFGWKPTTELLQRGANLSNADLSKADLSDLDLTGADMRRADIAGSDLAGAQLQGVTMYAYIAGRRWTIRLEHGETASQDQDQ